jgi:hypothetical protein
MDCLKVAAAASVTGNGEGRKGEKEGGREGMYRNEARHLWQQLPQLSQRDWCRVLTAERGFGGGFGGG